MTSETGMLLLIYLAAFGGVMVAVIVILGLIKFAQLFMDTDEDYPAKRKTFINQGE